MDAFDFAEEPKPEKPKKKPGSVLLTLGAYYFLASSLCLIGFFVAIYIDPYNPINPFMPPTPVGVSQPEEVTPVLTATAQATFTQAPAATETVALLPTETPLQATPTETFIPYPTPTNVVLSTSQPVDTPDRLTHFAAQEGTPAYIPYSGGCSGVYIAGNIIDIDDRPVMLMAVRATGTINGQAINVEVLSGSNPNYSESGWEIKLFDQLVTTTGQITVGLYPQGAWDPISDLVVIDTFNDCTRNLAVVNFVQDQ
ncbi:MAG TPA: hypothetical protein VLA32_11250 [Anaerolineales bacterium]|jgi:hypothetical protein|nr:hypothetical protein [Anaerolineales bacterium]